MWKKSHIYGRCAVVVRGSVEERGTVHADRRLAGPPNTPNLS